MLLTVKEVSEQLAVSRGCVYELISSGRLRHARIGCGRGTIRIPRDAVDALLADSLESSAKKLKVHRPRHGRALFQHLDAERFGGELKN
jgi:excisionase family DNA binding protein